jgi:MOSC domain-containing protein YiiM
VGAQQERTRGGQDRDRRRLIGEPARDRASDYASGVTEARTLRERLLDVPGAGRITWIGVRPAHEAPMRVLDRATLVVGRGIEGDRAFKGGGSGKRNVTLVQEEHLPVIASLLARAPIAPELVRRNLVVSGLNLIALKTLRFRIGDEVILEGTGPCEPCAKMDTALGEGGFHAMRGHGGITARIVKGGVIAMGDAVSVVHADEA